MAKRKRRKYTGPVYHNHHIYYGDEVSPEWTVSIRSWMHRAVTLLSQMNATPEHYAEAVNFQTAINMLVNRMRMRLDTEGDK